MHMESSETRKYPSLIQTYFDTHTVDGVFLQDEARIQYEEMLKLRDLGANTPTGVRYTEDQIMAMVRRGKQRGNIPGVGMVLAGQGRGVISIDEPRCTHTDADINEVKKENNKLRKEVNILMTVVRSDGGCLSCLRSFSYSMRSVVTTGVAGGGDDELGKDEDADEEEDADGDEHS
ncbi:hypothetical protein Tco_0755426 [Tanacetum coccineum]